MTTAAEIKQALTAYPADAQHLAVAPSSLLAEEAGHDQLARDIVALANRDGGRIVLGVDVAGRYEDELTIAGEAAEAALQRLLDDWTAPRVPATLEHLSSEDGSLLVIGVPRRTGSPHAVARTNSRGSVGARLYCVRDRDRTLPVSDPQLAWLFADADAEANTRRLEFTLHAGEGGSLREDVLQPRVSDAIEALLAGLPEAYAREILGDPAKLQQAAVELSSWAFLEELADVLRDMEEIESAEQSLDDLPVPGSGSVFAGLDGGLRGLLGGPSPRGVLIRLLRRGGTAKTLLLPAGAEVQVDYLARMRKARVTIHGERLRLAFSAEPAAIGEGLRWPGIEMPDLEGVTWASVRAELHLDLPFPSTGKADTHTAATLAAILGDRLAARWDDRTLHETVSPAAVERLLTR